jgi:hypothetical protein
MDVVLDMGTGSQSAYAWFSRECMTKDVRRIRVAGCEIDDDAFCWQKGLHRMIGVYSAS